MADEFHPVLTPRVADKPDAVVTLSFDDPTDAESVVIQLFEVDVWGSGAGRVVENEGKDTLLAELTGKIVQKKFVLDKKTPKGTLGAKPEMVLHIDGQESPLFVNHSLPFPESALANENGVYEVEARVSGVIKKKKKSGKTQVPLFLRNFKAGRPVVSFITGSLGDPFFAAADKYWKTVADGKFQLGSIEGIRNFLITQADARGFGPWGEVNIVDHGNEFEWAVKLFASDTAVSHVHTKDLKKNRSDPRFAGAIPSLDGTSRIIIRGCSIGNDQALLDEIRDLFGGKSSVFAPKFIQVYITSGDTARETFMDMFFFYVPGSSAPSDNECKQKLSAKFPSVKDADWLPMLKKSGKLSVKQILDGFRHDRTEVFRLAPTFTFTHASGKPSTKKEGQAQDFLAIGRSIWKNDEDHFNTDFDDWKWSQGDLQRRELSDTETQFVRVLSGSRHRVEVRREKRDANGVPVRPDPDNPDLFGRSDPASSP
jgi:hypothetical protein